jgi:hypothetical protein
MIVRHSLTAVAGLLLAALTALPAVAYTVAYYRYSIDRYQSWPPTFAGHNLQDQRLVLAPIGCNAPQALGEGVERADPTQA